MDEHAVARADLERLGEGLPGGEAGQRHGGGLLEGEGRGLAGAVRSGAGTSSAAVPYLTSSRRT